MIAGPDQLGFKSEIQGRVRALGIDAHVVFAGALYGAEKAAILAATDIFVLPSFSEGVPMAVLEAMAWGIPVLATRACNIDVETPGAGTAVRARALVDRGPPGQG